MFLVVQSVNKKIKLLNKGHYKNLDKYDLFVFSKDCFSEDQKKELLYAFVKKNKSNKTFQNIYLLHLDGIIKFDMKNKEFTTHPFNKPLQEIINKAHLDVEDM